MKIKIKKLISVILIVAIVLSSNGVFTFADSIDDVLASEPVGANEDVGANFRSPEEEPEEESELEEESVGAKLSEPEDDPVRAKLGEPEDDPVGASEDVGANFRSPDEEEPVGANLSESEPVGANFRSPDEVATDSEAFEEDNTGEIYDEPNDDLETNTTATASDLEPNDDEEVLDLGTNQLIATKSEVFFEIIASSSIISDQLFGDADRYILTNEWTGSAGYAVIGTLDNFSTYRKDSIVEITIATRAELVPTSPDWTWNLPNSNGLVGYIYDTNKILIYASENKEIYADANGKELFSSYVTESTFQSVETINNLYLLNTSLVTTMEGMFKGMNSLTSIDLSNFDVSNVTDMSSMFFECEALTNIDISHFNTENVTDFLDMFNTCSALLSIDMSNFNTTNVTSMSGMFYHCDSLQSAKLKNMSNNNLIDISNMFAYCTSLNEINLENFKTDSVTNMRAAFMDCSNLQVISLLSFNTSNVTNMSYMFYGDGNLQRILVPSIWSTEGITNPQGPSGEEMFRGCSSLVGGRGTTIESMITSTGWTEMYASSVIGARIDYGIGSLEGDAGYLTLAVIPSYIFAPMWFNSAPNALQKRNIHLIKFLNNSDGAPTDYVYSFELNDSNGLIAYVKNCSDGLYNLYDLEVYPPNNLDIYLADDSSYLFSDENDPTEGFINLSYVTNLSFLNAEKCRSMAHMFDGCRYLTSFSYSLNTKNVTNMSYMFYNATGLQVVNLTRLDTRNVTNMSYMFYNNTSLTVMNLSGLDTRKVTDMSYMFSRAKIGVMEFDISSFDTSNVANMSYMFANCTYISTIYVSPLFTTNNVTDGTNMFDNCERLRGADGTSYDNKIWSDPEHAKDFDYAKIDVSGSREGYFTDKVYYSIERNWCNHNFVNYSGFSKANINRITFERGSESEPQNYIHTWDIPDGRGLKGYLISETEITIYAPICASIYTDADAVNMFSGFVNCEAIENLYMLDTSKATDLRRFFYNCQKVKTLDLSTFNTKNVTDMGAMFWECHSLVSLDVSNFDTSNVTSMWRMFENCSAMKTLDLSNFDVRNVRSFVRMFQFMTSLEELDISNFNTLNGNDFQGMFLGLTSIKVLNLTSFRSNSSSPLYFYEAFSSCYNLKTIYVSIDFPLVGTNYDVFSRCYNLVGGEGTGYTSDHIGGDYARIDEGPSNPGYFTLYGGEIHGDKAKANLKGNGGRYSNGAANITVYIDEFAPTNTLEIPTRKGYNFDGYLVDGSPINQYWIYGKVEKDVVASWSPITYKIIYHPNGGTGNMPIETVEYGQDYRISANTFTKEGYDFTGWALSTNSNAVYSDREIFYADEEYREEINLYAKWIRKGSEYGQLYKITWDLRDGTTTKIGSWDGEAGDAQYMQGIGIDKLPTNVKGPAGCEFDHWEIDGIIVTSIPTDETGAKIIKAVYRDASYKIHWALDGGSWEAGFTPDETYTYGVGLTLPTNRYVPANGKRFNRWLLQFDGSDNPISATEISATDYGNVSVIAECANMSYSITYIDESGNPINWDGDIGPAGYTYGTGITYIPTNIVLPQHKEFDHWEIDGQRVDSIGPTEIGDKTLVAIFKNKKYNITWHLDDILGQVGDWDGEAGKDTYTYGTEYILPTNIIAPRSTSFSYWTEDGLIATTSIPIYDSGDKEFYAFYEPIRYDIKWNLNGANIDESVYYRDEYYTYQELIYAGSIRLPYESELNIPTGREFSHWEINGSRATAIEPGTMGDIEVSLVFEDTPTHNITWNYGTGEDSWSFDGWVAPATYSEGIAVVFPDKSFVQTSNGRELDYFTVDDGTGAIQATEIASTSTADVEVAAVLKNLSYRIKYILGDGSWDGVEGETSYTHGLSYMLPTNVIGPRGQEFDHWEIGGVTTTSILATDYGHKELTAVYRNKTYNIIWNTNNATITSPMPNTYTYGTEVLLPQVSSITGFEGRKFSHWTVNGAKLSSIPPTQIDDVTVELHYLTYQISWELGDGKLINYVRRDSYECGVAFTLPTSDQVVAPIDYEFDYWMVNNMKATEISASTVGSVTVVAVYKPTVTPGPNPPAKTISRIKIQNKPSKLSYIIGETFNPNGLVIRVVYSDNTTKDVVYGDTTKDGFRFTPALTKSLTIEDKQVVVIYLGKVAVFDISVESSRGGGGNTGGGGGGSGDGGHISGIITDDQIAPLVTYIDQVKTIKLAVDSRQITWVYEPIANKFKMNINIDDQTILASNGFYLVNNTVSQNVNGLVNFLPTTQTYYFDRDGYMITGWIKTTPDNKWYFVENIKSAKEGMMVFGWHKIQDKWYYFADDGSMLANSMTPDGYSVGTDGKLIL